MTAFALLETILTVTTIALIVLLTLPGLWLARHSAVQVSSRSRLAQHAAALTAYTSDYSGVFPFITSPTATYSIVWCGGVAYQVPRFFDAEYFWSAAMAEYEQLPCGHASLSPDREADGGPEAPDPWYLYSATLITDPKF